MPFLYSLSHREGARRRIKENSQICTFAGKRYFPFCLPVNRIRRSCIPFRDFPVLFRENKRKRPYAAAFLASPPERVDRTHETWLRGGMKKTGKRMVLRQRIFHFSDIDLLLFGVIAAFCLLTPLPPHIFEARSRKGRQGMPTRILPKAPAAPGHRLPIFQRSVLSE